MEETWKEIEPNIWKPENEGDSITGVLLSKEPKDSKREMSAKYKVENEQGIFLVWGSAVLDDRMECINTGTKVRITFKEKKEIKKGRTLNVYKVEVAAPAEKKQETA